MDKIAANSASYPYLAIARRFSVTYGLVLCAADALEAKPGNVLVNQIACDHVRTSYPDCFAEIVYQNRERLNHASSPK